MQPHRTGINLATNSTGYFPSLYVIDCNYKELFQTVNYFGSADDDSGLNCECSNEFDCSGWIDSGKQAFQMQLKERFYLQSLGTLEVAKPSGNAVLQQSIRKVIRTCLAQANEPADQHRIASFMCILEISERGLRFYNHQNQLNGSPNRTAVRDERVSDRTDKEADAVKRTDKEAAAVERTNEATKSVESKMDEQEKTKEKSERSIEEVLRGYVQIKFKEEKEREKREAKANYRSHNGENAEQNKATVSEEAQENKATDAKAGESAVRRESSLSSQCSQFSHTTKEPATPRQEDYFFHLKNITYCGSEDDYFAFITQHPQVKCKYACHVFNAQRPQVAKDICESIGKAFQRFYLNYIELSQNFVD